MPAGTNPRPCGLRFRSPVRATTSQFFTLGFHRANFFLPAQQDIRATKLLEHSKHVALTGSTGELPLVITGVVTASLAHCPARSARDAASAWPHTRHLVVVHAQTKVPAPLWSNTFEQGSPRHQLSARGPWTPSESHGGPSERGGLLLMGRC